jgi:hypothetical protein
LVGNRCGVKVVTANDDFRVDPSLSFADTMPGEIAKNINSARFSISFLPSFVRDTF